MVAVWEGMVVVSEGLVVVGEGLVVVREYMVTEAAGKGVTLHLLRKQNKNEKRSQAVASSRTSPSRVFPPTK